jgi:hypothetical protein
MIEEEYDEFIREAWDYLYSRIDYCKTVFGLSRYQRWEWDLDKGQITFSNDGVPMVIANFQVVGSLSEATDTWLWSWANPHIKDDLVEDMFKVKAFGERHGLKDLIEEKWSAAEKDGWIMTAISLKLLESAGAYRCPVEYGYWFILFKEIWHTSHAELDAGADPNQHVL